MKGIKKRSIVIAGHSTSLSLEEEFWEALKEIAAEKRVPVREIIGDIDAYQDGRDQERGYGRLSRNLSSALRIFVLEYYKRKNEA